MLAQWKLTVVGLAELFVLWDLGMLYPTVNKSTGIYKDKKLPQPLIRNMPHRLGTLFTCYLTQELKGQSLYLDINLYQSS